MPDCDMPPELQPLQQWICDTCGQVIQAPDQGWFEMRRDAHNRLFGFNIVHHSLHSPLRDQRKGGCYDPHGDMRGDYHLDDLTGPDGLARLMSFLDPGEHNRRVPELDDVTGDLLRAWVTVTRRLHTPHFEEAFKRGYIERAIQDGRVDGHEMRPYTQQSLLDYIRDYRER